MDPISMVVILGVALASGGAGAVLGRRRRGKQPKPICSCKHSLAFHDPETQRCHGLVNGSPIRFNIENFPVAWEKVPCTCRQYIGPIPADQMLASFTYPPVPQTPQPKPPTSTTD